VIDPTVNVPQAVVKEVLACITGVQGVFQIEPYFAGFTDQITYTVNTFTEEGFLNTWDDVVPVGQRWPRPFVVRTPTPGTPEAWCRGVLYNDDFFLFVNEIPDWGPCDGTAPGPVPNPISPGVDPNPIAPSMPGGILYPGHSSPVVDPLIRLLARSSPHSLKVFAAALQAAGVVP